MPRQAPWKGNNMADGLTTLTHWWVYFLILAEHIAGLRVKNEVHRRNKSADIFYNCVFFMTGRFTGSGPRTVTELVRKVFVNRSDYILFPVNTVSQTTCLLVSTAFLQSIEPYFCIFEGVQCFDWFRILIW